jgi:hypothetical protein
VETNLFVFVHVTFHEHDKLFSQNKVCPMVSTLCKISNRLKKHGLVRVREKNQLCDLQHHFKEDHGNNVAVLRLKKCFLSFAFFQSQNNSKSGVNDTESFTDLG